MSITLAMRGVGEESPKLTLEGPRIVLGRGAGSDVRIPDSTVSHRHATIRAERSEYVLIDEGSANGTWVGGVRLSANTPRTLRNGDLIRLGRIWIEVRFESAVPTPDLAGATRDIAFALVAGALEALGDDVTTRVRVVEGTDTGEELRLDEEDRAYVVGRGDDCDLRLSDAEASRRHMLITRRGSQVYVQDLASRHGVALGEHAIPPGRDIPWRANAMVKLARTVLALEEPVALALRNIEADTDRKMTQEELAEPPPMRGAPSSQRTAEGSQRTAEGMDPEPASIAESMQAAPIAEVPKSVPLRVPARRRRSSLTRADWAIVVVAVIVLVVSLAGLYFLLRGG